MGNINKTCANYVQKQVIFCRGIVAYNKPGGRKYFSKLPHEQTIVAYYILFNFYNND